MLILFIFIYKKKIAGLKFKFLQITIFILKNYFNLEQVVLI